MKKFNTFYFTKIEFNYSSLQAQFHYSFDNEVFFEEIIDFNNKDIFCDIEKKDNEIIDNILFHIHIALGISYYKLFPTKQLIINSGFLDEEQIVFWKKFYTNGLGEFFIKNDINPKGLLNFISPPPNPLPSRSGEKFEVESDNILLPWGGGKDSIVSSILLEKLDSEITPFVFGKIDDIKKQTLEVFGKKPLLVKRKLSENLFALNKEGYYNGHVPITGIIAFISQMVSYLYDYKYVVLSNEKSASEENIVWKGLKINHQYSKSGEFEQDFSHYVKAYISEDSNYFSLLSGMYEYKIAEIFSKKAQSYFSTFSSCNRNFVITPPSTEGFSPLSNNWCNKCEKCCFVYLILSAFLSETDLFRIFGTNLLEDEALLSTFEELIGISGNKPFECVGTYEESLFSAYKSINNYKKNNLNLPFILQSIEKKVFLEVEKIGEINLEKKLLKIHNKKLIPNEIKKVLL